MEHQSWVTLWETWRTMMGTPSSAVRREVNRKLETQPCMLYWGDSWFSTPLYKNLARQSMGRIKGMGMLVGKPGARAEQLFTRSEVKEKLGRLEAWPFDLICLSAGGNDALSDRLREVFKTDIRKGKPGTLSAQDAYARFLQAGIFPAIVAAYRLLLDGVGDLREKSGKSHLQVVGHSYCRIVRLGASGDLTVANIGLVAWLKGEVGPWLWSVMQGVVTDPGEGQRFADLLIGGFRSDVMQVLANDYGAFFHAADFHALPAARTAAFWFDEIHPTEAGFLSLAVEFNRVIRTVLPAAKQASVS